MKHAIRTLAVLGTLLASASLMACPYDGYGYRGWHGYGDGDRMREGRYPYMDDRMDSCMYDDCGMYGTMRGAMGGTALLTGPALSRLGLDQSQSQRVTALQRELNQRLTALDTDRVAQEGRLREMYSDPAADRAKTAATAQRLAELHRSRAEVVRSTVEQVDALLTPEQRALWRRGARW